MAKSMVEKYEQLLAEDPASMVFVELAKALLDRGDQARAIDVCRRGLEHHPESVVGRVLWGRALISSGKPVEAMEQFDQAIAIDRENPYAYNLIGEVLLHKGLYRSALPILKKAVALQPADGRVRQWLDQATRALSGQAEPVNRDLTDVDPVRQGPTAGGVPLEATRPDVKPLPRTATGETVAGISGVFQSLAAREPEKAPAPPAEDLPFSTGPAAPVPPGPTKTGETVSGITGVFESLAQRQEKESRSPAVVHEVITAVTKSLPAQLLDEARGPAPTPPVLTPSETAAAPAPPVLMPVAPPAMAAEPGAAGPASEEGPKTLETPRAKTPPPMAAQAAPSSGGLLDDLPPPEESSEAPPAPVAAAPLKPAPPVLTPAAAPKPAPPVLTPVSAAPPVAPAGPGGPPPITRRISEPNVQVSADLFAPPPLPKKPGLLEDLPAGEETAALPTQELPKAEISPDAAENIAREYENQLREKMLAKGQQSFFRRNFLKLGLAAVLLIGVAVGAGVYVNTRHKNRDNDLITLRSQAFRALTLDTAYGYRTAIEQAGKVLAISPKDDDARAAAGFANAVLYRDFGHEPGRRAEAAKDAASWGKRHPALAMANDFYLAETASENEVARKPILEATAESLPKGPEFGFERAEVFSIAGALLMGNGKIEGALEKYRLALEADPSHVRALVALGTYNASQGEPEEAMKFFERAKAVSPRQLEAIIGLLTARLASGDSSDPSSLLEEAKASYKEAAELDPSYAGGLKADLDLAEGRVLALQGRRVDAVTLLSNAASEYRTRASDFYAALGTIEATAGNYDKAEQDFAKALAARPGDSQLKEELGRALIARGHYAEALKKTEDKAGDDRRLRIVRGLARLEMGDLTHAREELAATRRDGKYPAEAVIYMAMVDAASGQRDTAKSVLEKVVKGTKARSAAHVALGRILLAEGKRYDAMAEFQAAQKDARDWEGSCSVGRLLLEDGDFAGARKALSAAVERNHFHNEALSALGQAELSLGDAESAAKRFSAVLAERPDGAALRGLSRSLLAQGDVTQARVTAGKAARVDPRSPDTARLLLQVALASGDTAGALKQVSFNVRANPKDPDAACDLGELQLKLGDAKAAKKTFEGALKLDPKHVRARLGIVNASIPALARQVLRDSEALVAETASADAALKARALAMSSRVFLSLANTQKAEARAREAIAALDGSADAHYALALVAKKTQDRALALSELKRVVALDPTLSEAHLAFADSLAGDKDFEHALAEVETYLRIAPNGPNAPDAKKIRDVLKKRVSAD